MIGVIDDPWFYTPALYPDAGMPRPLWQRQGRQEMEATQQPHVVYFQPPESPDYVTLSTLEYFDKERLLRASNLSTSDAALVQQWADQKRRLIDGYRLLGGQPFGGPDRTVELTYREDMAYVHPYVYVWKRKDLP